jgi:Protein of unknown function (DUF1579)
MIRRNENHRIERHHLSTQATTSEYQHSLIQVEHVEPCPGQHFPKPGPEHEWLQQFVGEWEMAMECPMEPAKPTMKSKGTESVRSIDGLWVIAESKSTFMDKYYGQRHGPMLPRSSRRSLTSCCTCYPSSVDAESDQFANGKT